MPEFDAIIVGAGLMGSAAANYLAKDRKRVLVLEQFHLLHKKGSSSGESRITRFTYPSTFYVRLMTHAYKLWAEAEREAGIRVFEETGGIDILENRAGGQAADLIEACESHGVPIEKLSPPEVLDRFGMTIPEDSIGVYQKSSGVLRATTAVSMLQSLARNHGAVFRDHTKVKQITEKTDGTIEVTAESNSGEMGSFSCSKVIVACGAWAQPVLQKLFGISVDLQVWQTTVCYWRPKGEEGSAEYAENRRKLDALPVFIDYGSEPIWATEGASAGGTSSGAGATPSGAQDKPCIYSCPALDFSGLIKIAVHHGRNVTADTRTFEPDVKLTIDPVKKWISSHLPWLDTSAPVSCETCMYTMTKDEAFIVDTLPSNSNIIIAAGFSGHGFKMGTVVGAILAEMAIKGESTSFGDLGPFKITRSAVGFKEVVAAASSGTASS
jgi:sarcosine oxidase / L-pipecolate oxidase